MSEKSRTQKREGPETQPGFPELPLIFRRNTDSRSGDNKIRISDIVKPRNTGVKPGIPIESLRNIPQGIAPADPVGGAFFGNACRHIVRRHRRGGTIAARSRSPDRRGRRLDYRRPGRGFRRRRLGSGRRRLGSRRRGLGSRRRGFRRTFTLRAGLGLFNRRIPGAKKGNGSVPEHKKPQNQKPQNYDKTYNNNKEPGETAGFFFHF